MAKKPAPASAGRGLFQEVWTRSLAKAVTYRILIVILDFSVLFLLTGKVDVALWFVVVSNVYTTVAYYGHERLWDRIGWGKKAAEG